MGLQALSSYAEKLTGGQKAATVTFKSMGQQDVTFSLNNDNAILLQSKNMVNQTIYFIHLTWLDVSKITHPV